MTKFEQVQHITTEEYFKNGGEFSIDVWKTKYPINDLEKNYPAYLFKRLAKTAAQYEQKENQQYWIEQWFDELWNGYWRPAGSILNGLGNDKKISTANCTTISIDDDNLESIFVAAYKVAKAAAYRQGLGLDFSALRPDGAILNNSARISTGTLNWMKFIDTLGNRVGQNSRIPAMLFSLNIKHPDIIKFLTLKSNQHEIQNANISVQITDDFMHAVENDLDWTMEFFVKDTGELIQKTINARELLKMIAKEAHGFAEPGIQLIDTCKKESVSDVFGFPIKSTNACSEKFMHPDSTCVLASVNAVKFFKNEKLDLENLKKIGKSITRFLDNVITYELEEKKYPFLNQKNIVSQLREIGVGITNLHGYLLQYNVGYDSDKGIDLIEEFVKNLSLTCWQESINLGKEKGNALAFDYLKNKLTPEEFEKYLLQSNFLKRLIKEHNFKFDYLRNINVMSIAPTGSISLTFPEEIDSTGIEPIIAYYYWKRTRVSGVWQWYFVIPSIVRKKLIENGYTNVPTSILDNDGKIGKYWIDIINKIFDPSIFKPAHHINPLKKVEMMSRITKYIDSSISVTYNIKETDPPELVEQIYYHAWKSGVKSVSVYRDKSRQGVIEFESPTEVEKRFKKLDSRPDTIQVHAAAKRPKELPCNIHFINVNNIKYVLLIGILHGIPYEIFAIKYDNISELDKSDKSGIIKKVGKGKYDLIVKTDTEEKYFKNLGTIINDPEISDFTRLISTMLRHGVAIDFIVEQLEKSKSSIVSLSKGIARILKNYVGEYYKSGIGKICFNCQSTNLEYKEGCFYCIDCGSSKCG